jgi:hypothetical protein
MCNCALARRATKPRAQFGILRQSKHSAGHISNVALIDEQAGLAVNDLIENAAATSRDDRNA